MTSGGFQAVFGIALILLGLFVEWALFTGKVQIPFNTTSSTTTGG